MSNISSLEDRDQATQMLIGNDKESLMGLRVGGSEINM